MSDATGLSADLVVNQFCVQQRAKNGFSPSQFFQSNMSISAELYGVPVVVADIRARLKNESPIDLEAYFDQLPHLKLHRDAWQILEAAEPWLVEREGPNWRQAWLKRLPGLIAESERQSTGADSFGSQANPAVEIDFDRLEPGDKLLNFEISRMLGRGTYGVVYLACNSTLGRDVALKITSGSGHEGRALARLNHENIVRVYGEYSFGKKQILEMQFVLGGSLDHWVAERKNKLPQSNPTNTGGENYLQWVDESQLSAATKYSNDTQPLSRESAPAKRMPDAIRSNAEVSAWIVGQLADALQHSHGRGILHQDIKPANILIDASGNPMLTDFNVAFIVGQHERDAIGGTVNYMSPEQLRAYTSGDTDSIYAVDLRSDIYSLGIVLLELLGGQKVWGNVNSNLHDARARQLLASRLKSPPRQTTELPGVKRSLAAIVDKALQPNPNNRYQSAGEMATDLSRWLSGQSNVHASNPSCVERCVRFAVRQRLLVSGIICGLVMIFGLLFFLTSKESEKLRQCNQLLTTSERAILEGRGAKAAEQLGNAKAQLDQLWISPWYRPAQFSQTQLKAIQCSKQLNELELVRFSSLFGQASLLSIHQNGSDAQDDGSDLVKESLNAYRVMTDLDWQLQPPFSQLSAPQQMRVAENITELMMVSMINSSKTTKPTPEQWTRVLDRLPEAHNSLGIFETLRSGGRLPSFSSADHVDLDGFETYLFGVWATCLNDDTKAYHWYYAALDNHQRRGGQSRFWLRYRQGLTCQRLGYDQEALIHYAVCLGMRPGFAWLPFNMALVHSKLKQTEAAINRLEHAIRLDPLLTAAYVALGAIQFETGDHQAALSTYQRAMAAGATSPELIRNREIIESKSNFR